MLRIFALVPSINQGSHGRHFLDYSKTFSKWSNNSGNLDITLYRCIWNIFPLNFSRFTFRVFWPKCWVFFRIFALVPSINQGSHGRHFLDYSKTFSKWSNNSRNLDITCFKCIWNVFPLTSCRFTFRIFWPKSCNFPPDFRVSALGWGRYTNGSRYSRYMNPFSYDQTTLET